MCGRYYIDDSDEEMLAIIDAVNRRSVASPVKMSGEIFPTDTVPVIASSRSLKPSAFAMTWGYTLPDGRRIINARSESAADRPLFRDGMLQRRCAVPGRNYFEWERDKNQMTKYAIRPRSEGLMYMAGIYRIENSLPVFAILTRVPSGSIAFIHDRMPVLLPTDAVTDWINPRCAADAFLKRAILDVRFLRAE